MEQVFLQRGGVIRLLAAFTLPLGYVARTIWQRFIEIVAFVIADKTDRGFGRRTALDNDRLTFKAKAHGQLIVTNGFIEGNHNVIQNIGWVLVEVEGAGVVCGHGIIKTPNRNTNDKKASMEESQRKSESIVSYYFFFTLLLPTQPHFLRDRALGELRSERQSPLMLLLRAQ